MDSQDRILERSDATLAIPILGPGASAPFSAMFRAEGGTQVSAKISGYRPADRQPLPIDVALNRRTSSGDGQLAVVGTMTNPNSSPVKLIGFTLAASDPDHVLLSLNSNWFGLVGLAAGQTAPFLALLPSSDDLTHLQSYAAAEPAADLPQIAIDLPVQPVLQTDDQGNPIVLAVVHNHGKAPSMVRILITLTGPLGPASAALYASPIPLAPDEQRPFSLTEFPGLAHQLASGDQNLSELQPEALIDPSGSSPASQEAVPLEIEITTYEAIGGTILVHGTAYNQSQARVLQPTVIGALRSTSGDIWSAGEASLGQELASDSQVAFLLVMPRPARIEPSEGEFDVRGLGLVP